MIYREDNAIDRQGYHAKPRSQPVDTVYQVDGIRDKDHQKKGQWDADEWCNSVYAKQSIEVVDVQASQGEHQRGEYLDDELLAIANAYQIVSYTYYI